MTSTLTVWLFGGLKSQHVRRTKSCWRPRIMIKDEQILGCRKSEDGLRHVTTWWVWMVKWWEKAWWAYPTKAWWGWFARDISFNWLSTNNTNRCFGWDPLCFLSVFFCQEANCRIRSVLWGWSSTLSGEYGRIPACKGIKCWEVLPGKVKVHWGNRKPPWISRSIAQTLAMPRLEFIDVKNSRMRVCSGLLEGMIFGENSLLTEDQIRLPQFWCCYIICWRCMSTGMNR